MLPKFFLPSHVFLFFFTITMLHICWTLNFKCMAKKSIAAIAASTLLERLSIRCWIMDAGIHSRSLPRASVRSSIDVRWWWCLARSVQVQIKGVQICVQPSQVLPYQTQQIISIRASHWATYKADFKTTNILMPCLDRTQCERLLHQNTTDI